MSKASHADELITRINHADINCKIFTSDRKIVEVHKSAASLRTLIRGIGDYLTRVVGSVPSHLKITLQVYDKMTSVHPRASFGPLYYEGPGHPLENTSLGKRSVGRHAASSSSRSSVDNIEISSISSSSLLRVPS